MFSTMVDILGYICAVVGITMFHYDVLVEKGRQRIYAVLGESWMVLIGLCWFLVSIIH